MHANAERVALQERPEQGNELILGPMPICEFGEAKLQLVHEITKRWVGVGWDIPRRPCQPVVKLGQGNLARHVLGESCADLQVQSLPHA